MVDMAGLDNEAFEDFASNITLAIRILKERRDEADKRLLRQMAPDYNDYLKLFIKAHAYSEIIDELETLKQQRKESI